VRLIALLSLPLLAQTSGYLTVGQAPQVVAKRGGSAVARIPVTVQPGYHVNSNTPSEEFLIPLRLTWKSTGALQAGAVTYPKPNLEKYEFSEKPLSVFTGKFELTVPLKAPPDAPVGPGAAVGQLRYQACNDRACFPPKTLEVTVPYAIQ
jgi:hypothetical protein